MSHVTWRDGRRATVRVGVIGTGLIGTEHARTLARRVAGAAVAAVFDVDGGRAQAVAGEVGAVVAASAEALIGSDDVDAVVVATPGAFHAPHVLACIAAAKPVMCEKPLATAVEDCVAVLDAEVATGRRLVQVGFMRRFDPGYREVKAAIDEGRIGQPLVLHNIHRNPAVPPGFSNELMMYDALVHEFDTCRWLLDDEITAISVLSPRPTPNAPEGLLDPQIAIFETASGVLADVEMFANCTFGYDVRCEAVGTEGVAALETPRLSTVTARGSRAEAIPESWKARFGDAYRLELQAWVDAARDTARDGAATGPSAWDGYAATAIAARAVDAQHSGERATVELIDRPDLYA